MVVNCKGGIAILQWVFETQCMRGHGSVGMLVLVSHVSLFSLALITVLIGLNSNFDMPTLFL